MSGDLFAVLDGAAASAVAPLCVIEHPCAPRGKGRPKGRIVKPRTGPAFVHFYTDEKTRAYEAALAQRAKIAMGNRPPLAGPLAVRVFAMMPIPKSYSARDRDAALAGTKFHMKTPDGDNIIKAVLDSFNAIVWADDKQVVRSLVVKEYAEFPGLIVEVYGLP